MSPCLAGAMHLSLVGAAEVRVPLLGLGCAPLADFFHPLPGQQVEDLIDYALKSGASFFDTAPQYGCGLSERRLGKALQDVPRPDYVLASKVGRLVTGEKQLEIDYSTAGVRRSLEESLIRLDQDRIDIAHIHDPDQHFHEALEMAFPALAELRTQGMIGAIGAGMNQWPMLLEFARSADFDCFMLAGRYTLLEQESLPLLDVCSQKGIAVFLGGVYNTGILATGAIGGARYSYRPAPAEILARVSRIEAVCSAFEVPLRAAALQFSAAHPAVKSLVIGAESRQEFAQAFDGLCYPIPPDFWQALRTARLIDESAPVPLAS